MRIPSNIYARLFPDIPRDFPGRRIARSILRTAHIFGGGVLIGAYLFNQPDSSINIWYITALVSGLLLFLSDLHSSLAVLFEWRGLSIVSKIGILWALPLLSGYEIYALTLILIIGSLSSHSSRKFRHRLWLTLPNITQDDRHG